MFFVVFVFLLLFLSYGLASVEGKLTHYCGMDEKRVWVNTPCLVLISSQSLLALSSRRSRPISREKQTANSLFYVNSLLILE